MPSKGYCKPLSDRVSKYPFTVGQQFGFWKVLPDPKEPENPYFCLEAKESGFSWVIVRCVCTHCGKIYNIRPLELLSEKTKSCKVCSGGSLRERDKNKTWRGYKEIPGRVLGELRGGSRWRGRTGRECPIEITLEDIWDVYVQQNKKCAFTGLPVSFFRTEKSIRSNDPEARLARTASIDRIDNTKGYVKGNIRIVHQVVNIMKNQFSDEMFIEFCELVTREQALARAAS